MATCAHTPFELAEVVEAKLTSKHADPGTGNLRRPVAFKACARISSMSFDQLASAHLL